MIPLFFKNSIRKNLIFVLKHILMTHLNSVFTLIFLFLFNGLASGQEHKIIKNIDIYSSFLKEERVLNIYLPPGYNVSKERHYPVMYVLDGQEYFLQPIAYQNMLRFKDKSPDFIVVGINSDRRKRRTDYAEDSDKFTQFLKEELIPFIDVNYKTKKEKERLFFGWEMAGGLGVGILAKQPSLFSAFILASPTYVTNERLNRLEKNTNASIIGNKYIHFTKAPEEFFIEESLNKLDSIFKTSNSQKVTWNYNTIEGENHYSTPTKTIHNALSDYFFNYNPIRFFSLKEYDEFGGLPALIDYYKKRGKRFSVSKEIHKETKHFLMLNAMKEKNIERLEYYNKALGNYLETQLSRGFWVNRYAKFYAEMGDTNRALSIYKLGLKKFPESAIIYNGLGNTYKQLGKFKKAKKSYVKAIAIAETNKDLKLKEYRFNLNNL